MEELKLQQLMATASRLVRKRRAIEAEAAESAREVLAQASIDPVELTTLESYGLHLRRRILELTNQERKAEEQVREQRQRVIEARRQYELLDHLYQKAHGEWVAALNKEQEETAAELYLAKSVRKRAQARCS